MPDTRHISWPPPPEDNVRLRGYLSGVKKKMEERLKYVEGVPPSAVPGKYLSDEAKQEQERVAKYGGIRNPRWYDPGEEGFGLLFASPIAYHGSPWKFDQFSKARVNTGEGAQAYGHGLYFAEDPGVAGWYAKNLSKEYNNLYKVEIKQPSEKFLDWDKPLGEHPEADKILDKISEYITGSKTALYSGDRRKEALGTKVGEFYRSLVLKVGFDKEASEAINYAGIPGIRYLDANSRNVGKGKYNYVVFDDRDVKILERTKIDNKK